MKRLSQPAFKHARAVFTGAYVHPTSVDLYQLLISKTVNYQWVLSIRQYLALMEKTNRKEMPASELLKTLSNAATLVDTMDSHQLMGQGIAIGASYVDDSHRGGQTRPPGARSVIERSESTIGTWEMVKI